LASSKDKMVVKITVCTLQGLKKLSLFSLKSFSNYNRLDYTLEEIFASKVWGFGASGMDGTQQRLTTGPHISLAIFVEANTDHFNGIWLSTDPVCLLQNWYVYYGFGVLSLTEKLGRL
jgi:hypothetical protein